MKIPLAIAALSWAQCALAQMPFGEFRVQVYPKEAKVGQTVYFKAEINMMSGDGGWSSDYRIVRKTTSPPDTFLVLVRSVNLHGPVPLGSGYYGPWVSILPESLGVHLIRFDTTSEYQRDMADSAIFRVVPAARINPFPRISGEGFPMHWYRLDGGRIRDREPMPAFAR
jgi:hypothetical protein